MGEIIQFKQKTTQEPKYTAKRFHQIAMDQALASVLANTVIQHLKQTTASLELDTERCDLIMKEISKNINKKY